MDIQRKLLYHLRLCKGMVKVNAAYDGLRNANKEKAISARMGVSDDLFRLAGCDNMCPWE